MKKQENIIDEYRDFVRDIISHEKFMQMDDYIQHSDISCLEHCLYVSYTSYRLSRFLKMKYREVARGALLHDFFLYDWHKEKPYDGLHGFYHAAIALENANRYFVLTEIEQDIIKKHMWPLNIYPPRFRESFLVLLCDKYCAVMEIFKLSGFHKKIKTAVY